MLHTLSFCLPGIIFIPEIQIVFRNFIKFFIAVCYVELLSSITHYLIYSSLLLLNLIANSIYFIYINRLKIFCFLPDTLRLIYYIYIIINWLTTSEVENESILVCNMLPNNFDVSRIATLDLPNYLRCDTNFEQSSTLKSFLYTETENDTVVNRKNLALLNKIDSPLSTFDKENLNRTAYPHPVSPDKVSDSSLSSSSTVACYTMTTGFQPVVHFSQETNSLDLFTNQRGFYPMLKSTKEANLDAFSKVISELESSKEGRDLLNIIQKIDPNFFKNTRVYYTPPDAYVKLNVPNDFNLNLIPSSVPLDHQISKPFHSSWSADIVKLLNRNSPIFDYMPKMYFYAGDTLNGLKPVQLISCNLFSFPESMVVDSEANLPEQPLNDSFQEKLSESPRTRESFYRHKIFQDLFKPTTQNVSREYMNYLCSTTYDVIRFLKKFK